MNLCCLLSLRHTHDSFGYFLKPQLELAVLSRIVFLERQTSGSASWMSGGVDVGGGAGGIWSLGRQVVGLMIVMLRSWIGADMSEVWRV